MPNVHIFYPKKTKNTQKKTKKCWTRQNGSKKNPTQKNMCDNQNAILPVIVSYSGSLAINRTVEWYQSPGTTEKNNNKYSIFCIDVFCHTTRWSCSQTHSLVSSWKCEKKKGSIGDKWFAIKAVKKEYQNLKWR